MNLKPVARKDFVRIFFDAAIEFAKIPFFQNNPKFGILKIRNRELPAVATEFSGVKTVYFFSKTERRWKNFRSKKL